MTRRNLAGLGACLAVVLVALAVVLLGGDDDGHAVSESAGTATTDVAAPAPSSAAPSSAAPSSAAPSSSAPAAPDPDVQDRPGAGLPTSRARAAARLFLIGFGGPRASKSVRRL